MKVNPGRYRLLHSFSGRVLATSNRMSAFRKVINREQAGSHTVHDRVEGWFVSAEMVFSMRTVSGESEGRDE